MSDKIQDGVVVLESEENVEIDLKIGVLDKSVMAAHEVVEPEFETSFPLGLSLDATLNSGFALDDDTKEQLVDPFQYAVPGVPNQETGSAPEKDCVQTDAITGPSDIKPISDGTKNINSGISDPKGNQFEKKNFNATLISDDAKIIDSETPDPKESVGTHSESISKENRGSVEDSKVELHMDDDDAEPEDDKAGKRVVDCTKTSEDIEHTQDCGSSIKPEKIHTEVLELDAKGDKSIMDEKASEDEHFEIDLKVGALDKSVLTQHEENPLPEPSFPLGLSLDATLNSGFALDDNTEDLKADPFQYAVPGVPASEVVEVVSKEESENDCCLPQERKQPFELVPQHVTEVDGDVSAADTSVAHNTPENKLHDVDTEPKNIIASIPDAYPIIFKDQQSNGDESLENLPSNSTEDGFLNKIVPNSKEGDGSVETPSNTKDERSLANSHSNLKDADSLGKDDKPIPKPILASDPLGKDEIEEMLPLILNDDMLLPPDKYPGDDEDLEVLEDLDVEIPLLNEDMLDVDALTPNILRESNDADDVSPEAQLVQDAHLESSKSCDDTNESPSRGSEAQLVEDSSLETARSCDSNVSPDKDALAVADKDCKDSIDVDVSSKDLVLNASPKVEIAAVVVGGKHAISEGSQVVISSTGVKNDHDDTPKLETKIAVSGNLCTQHEVNVVDSLALDGHILTPADQNESPPSLKQKSIDNTESKGMDFDPKDVVMTSFDSMGLRGDSDHSKDGHTGRERSDSKTSRDSLKDHENEEDHLSVFTMEWRERLNSFRVKLKSKFRRRRSIQSTGSSDGEQEIESDKVNEIKDQLKGSGKEGDPSIWYVDTESDTSLPVVTNLMSSLAEPENHTTSTTNEKKAPPKTKPKHTIEYEVKLTDTLASIAAQFDTTPSELIKLNKLVMRTVFPSQVLYVPDGTAVLSEEESSPPPLVSPVEKMKFDVPLVKMADKPPAKVPGHVERQKTEPSPPADPTPPHKLTEDEAEQIDRECYERFIKINVKQITDGQGVVSGTLLVTPNAVMFDPNVSDPLVIEHGADKYGMITPMDMVMSAAMYHDIAAMKLRGQKSDGTSKHPIYHAHDCPMFHTKHHHGNSSLDHPDLAHNELSTDMDSMRPSRSTTVDSLRSEVDSMCSCGALSRDASVHELLGNPKSDISTPQKHSDVPTFEEESHHSLMRDPEYVSQDAENVSASASQKSDKPVDDILSDVLDYSDSFKTNSITSPEVKVTPRDSETESDISKDILQSHEAKTDANNSPADGQATDLETVKTEGEGSKVQGSDDASVTQVEAEAKDVQKTESDSKLENNAEADVVVKGNMDKMADTKLSVNTSIASDVPSAQFSPLKTSAQHLNNFVNYATGLFRNASDDNLVKDVHDMKLDQTDSKQPTLVVKGDKSCEVENAIKLADKPDLFQNLDKLIPKPQSGFDDPPLYLCLRVGQPKYKEVSQTCPIESYRGNKKKPEYWFSIPRDKVDQLYAFFVQWTPDIYGDEDDMDPEQRGFVVFDEDDLDAESSIEICDEHFASTCIQKIRKDWEIVSKVEAIRRMSSVDIEDMLPLPDLVGDTTILTNDEQIIQLSNALPPRTIGYPWTLVYSSENHGFSLKTLYRNMQGLDSPVLIVVEDTNGHVFGAVTNCPLKMSDHFYGTGESFLYTFYPDFKIFHWSGENNFFLKGNQESLAIGSGQGYFGLWFDGDLYHGRSQRCDTFDNDILTEKEDFCVKAFEAWAFV